MMCVCVCVDYMCTRTEDPGKAKVTEFDDLMFGDENIFRLHISVDTLKTHIFKITQ